MLKGKAQKTLQFRQFIWDMPGKLNAAEYQKGQELVLLLGPVSNLPCHVPWATSPWSSPSGWGQSAVSKLTEL